MVDSSFSCHKWFFISVSDVPEDSIFTAQECLKLWAGFGYLRRLAEMMVLDDHLKKLILKTSDANEISLEAIKSGMMTLLQHGSRKVMEGITTIKEVLRMTRI